MIVVKLTGGLGNQLFQYALARSLSIKNKDSLCLDISGFETYKLHAYALPNFNIVENLCTKNDLKLFFGNSVFDRVRRIIGKYHTIFEKSFEVDLSILEKKGSLYLNGYWQSERYFKEIRNVLLKDFTLNKPISEKGSEIKEKIRSTNSISMHIRRGDYLTNSQTNKIHGACDLEYYSNALSHIAKQIESPHFFVFSDDPIWTKENIKIGSSSTFVTHNDASTNYEDLYLMSQCKHHIIANSSFSWWGAWLCENKDKIVIAPKKWFNKNIYNEIVPENWIKL